MAKVTAGKDLGKYVGYYTAVPICINPNNATKAAVLGFGIDESKEESKYTGESQSGNRYCKITVFYNIKEINNPKIKQSFQFFLSEIQDNFGEQYLGYIDEDGKIARGTDLDDAAEQSAEKGYAFNKKTARILYRGETLLMKLYKAITRGTIVFTKEDLDLIWAGGDQSAAFLNTYFVVKNKNGSGKGFGGLFGLDNKGYIALYEQVLGGLDYIKTSLAKPKKEFAIYDKEIGGNYIPLYPEDYSCKAMSLEDIVDNPDDFLKDTEEDKADF